MEYNDFDKYELVGENLTYILNDFNKKTIERYFTTGDTCDKLPNANDFITLFSEKKIKQTLEFSICNRSDGILFLNPGDNMIFRDNIYSLGPQEKKEFMACIFSVEPCIIGVVPK